MHVWTTKLQIVQFLFETQPQAAREVNENGDTPLHLLCQDGHDGMFPVARFLIEACPASAAMLDKKERTPLHVLCDDHVGDEYDARANVALVQLLIEAYPEALNVKDGAGNTPFRNGVFRGSPKSILFASLHKTLQTFWKLIVYQNMELHFMTFVSVVGGAKKKVFTMNA